MEEPLGWNAGARACSPLGQIHLNYSPQITVLSGAEAADLQRQSLCLPSLSSCFAKSHQKEEPFQPSKDQSP